MKLCLKTLKNVFNLHFMINFQKKTFQVRIIYSRKNIYLKL